MRELRKTLCNRDCPDACSIVAHVEDERVVQLGGDPAHAVTNGFLCWRTNNFLPLQYSPARLQSPLLRGKPVSWDEALDFAASELLRIRSESGPAAIFNYRSGGSLGALKHLTDYFFSEFGPVTVKRGDICSGAGDEAQMLDFGEEDSPTKTGKVNLLASPPHSQVSPEYPLYLMAISTDKAQSSQWSKGQPEGPAVVTVHPDAARGLADGALGHLQSAIGSMTVRIHHDARQRRDVALLAKGGHLRDGRCANLLTRARATDLGGGAAFYDEAVRLAALP